MDVWPPNKKRAERLVEEAYLHYSPLPECPLCGGNEFKDYGVRKYKTIKFVKCVCGMVFQPTYFTQENLDAYYKNLYRLCVPPYVGEVTETNISGEYTSGKRYMQFIDVVPKCHLDIGSSTGSFLKQMQDAHGCESVGVEPGDIFREYSRDSGINTVANLSEAVGKFYDLITMAHVLEHYTNPLEELGIVRNLLEDDGHLFMEVPYMSVAHSHPLLFDMTTLEKLLNKAGFDITKSYLHEFNRISVMAEKRRVDETHNT